MRRWKPHERRQLRAWQLKRFRELSRRLNEGESLTVEEKIYFAKAFDRIGNGESADLVFRIKRGPGDKARDDTQKKKISLIFQLVATAILPKATANDSASSRAFGLGMTLEQAFEWVSPRASELFGNESPSAYGPEHLKKLWYDPQYAHMKSPFRSAQDLDSPFEFYELPQIADLE